MFTDRQECLHCGGAIPVEDFASEQLIDNDVTLLHCEFCSMGWETLWERRGGRRVEQFTVEFSAQSDPVAYGSFLQRLRDRRAA